VSLDGLLNHSDEATLKTVPQFPQAYLQAHAETLCLDILIVDTVLFKLSVEGELADSTADGSNDLAETVTGACYDGAEERSCATPVPSCLELRDELGRVSQDIKSGCHTHKALHAVHLTNPIDVLLP
jgi:hypothetical protein